MQNSELKTAIKKSKKIIIYAGIFSIFVNLLMLTPPLYMLQLYGRVVASRSMDTLFFLTLIVVILFIFMAVFEILRSRILVVFANKLDLSLSGRIYDCIFKLSAKNPANASSQAMSDLNTLKQYLSTNGVFAFLDAPWLPFYIFILFLFHPFFGYFSIASALIIFFIALINEKATKEGITVSNNAYRNEIKFIDLSLRNSEATHAMGMNSDLKKIWQAKHNEFLSAHSSSSLKAGLYSNLSKSLRITSQSLILGLGAYLVINMEINPGMMIAGSIIMGRALAPLDLLISSWKSYKGARQSYDRLSKFLQDFPSGDEILELPDPKGEISVENLTLIPPNSKSASLANINLNIKAGQMCAFIGHSAAGKSSLARAILGIWSAQSGVVRVDLADIRQYNPDRLGKFIGYLPQDIELFEGSVAQNIARFGEIDSNAVIKAAKMANVHEMILEFSDGYETKIGAGGVNLSGGEKQRIALARALYKDPKIIVLDEPNSSLDDEGESALLKTLVELKAKATILIISHKLNILQIVDKVAVLQNGQLIYFGDKGPVLEKISGSQRSVS
ncbi:type I secretion system permease/ATPase [Campylobacter sp.]|uniref:type I secretion system permease/ATPase n=1 Tax=Campylobacter sp. TaxID=205 RepID=UPI00270A0655|nr:type I secretion system permease/ATPase [Campylobacter sp.]